MQKKWNVMPDTAEESRCLAAEAGVSEVVAALLLHRGIQTAAEADLFLHPPQQQFYDPFLLKDMDKAVERICLALDAGEKIVVYGDYDVDGITSTTLLMRMLQRLGANAAYYIPDRIKEGYGFHKKALEHIAGAGVGLLISVDCGISALEETAAMHGKLDIIITDHHLPQAELPDVEAVINPHREDCPYPEKNLAGVGVAFKLCQALWQRIKKTDFEADLEIVALGTIADIVPLLGENRRIVYQGLKQMVQTDIIGLQALIEAAGLKDKAIGEEQIGYVLAPRLNAAGRMGSAGRGTELLLSEDRTKADSLAMELNEENTQRQLLERNILALAEQQLQSIDIARKHVLVLSGEGWHPGVIGIVASRIVDKYYRPVVVIGIQDGKGKGSCRSIRGFHMYEALTACHDLLTAFGGHAQAAGLSIPAANISALSDALEQYAVQHMQPDDFVPSVDIEAELPMEKIDFQLIHELEKLAPFGAGNTRPLFGCRGVRGSYARSMGAQGQHLRFSIELPQGEALTAIAWNMGDQVSVVNREPVDIVFSPEINEWNNRQSLQCKLQALAPSFQQDKFPSRDVLAAIYVFLRRCRQADCSLQGPLESMFQAYQQETTDASFYAFQTAVSVFEELGLLRRDDAGTYFMQDAPKQKLALTESYLYRQGMHEKC